MFIVLMLVQSFFMVTFVEITYKPQCRSQKIYHLLIFVDFMQYSFRTKFVLLSFHLHFAYESQRLLAGICNNSFTLPIFTNNGI